MSDATTTTAAEKGLSPFERLPTELIIQIFSNLPTMKCGLHLCLTSRRFRTVSLKNEGAIARGFAINLIGDDDPGVIKLAFMACESREVVKIDDRVSESEDSDAEDNDAEGSDADSEGNYILLNDCVGEFLDTYAHREAWPLKLCRLRGLHLLPKISMCIELLIDWIARYATIWPLNLETKAFTSTEITRLRRLLYAFEVGVTLFDPLDPLVDSMGKEDYRQLCNKFWKQFSFDELDSIYILLPLIGHSSFWTYKAWLECTGRNENDATDWPWHTYDDLRDILNSVRKNGEPASRPRHPWRRCSRLIRTMRRAHVSPDDPEFIHTSLLPFAEDPSTYRDNHDISRWLHSGNRQWRLREHYYDPRAYRYPLAHSWFFVIGDRDRCQRVRDQGPVWSWHGEPPQWTGTRTDPATEENVEAMIAWNEDPTLHGFQGSVGTVVDIRDL